MFIINKFEKAIFLCAFRTVRQLENRTLMEFFYSRYYILPPCNARDLIFHSTRVFCGRIHKRRDKFPSPQFSRYYITIFVNKKKKNNYFYNLKAPI